MCSREIACQIADSLISQQHNTSVTSLATICVQNEFKLGYFCVALNVCVYEFRQNAPY